MPARASSSSAELRGRFGFMAFHGGELERRTDRIATAAAEASGASIYTVVHPPPDPPHFPSTDVRRGQSEVLDTFLDHVDVVVTVHTDLGEALLVSGDAAEAKKQTLEALEIAPSFERAQDLLLKLAE